MLEIFLSWLVYTHNQCLVHHLTNALCQMCTTPLYTKENTPCTTFFYSQEDALYKIFFEWIQWFSYSLDTECVVDKVQYRKDELQRTSLMECLLVKNRSWKSVFQVFWNFSLENWWKDLVIGLWNNFPIYSWRLGLVRVVIGPIQII